MIILKILGTIIVTLFSIIIGFCIKEMYMSALQKTNFVISAGDKIKADIQPFVFGLLGLCTTLYVLLKDDNKS